VCSLHFHFPVLRLRVIPVLAIFNHFLINVSLQAEHGPDSQVVLVAVGKDTDVSAISAEVQRQLAELPRGNIAAKALDHSYVVVTEVD